MIDERDNTLGKPGDFGFSVTAEDAGAAPSGERKEEGPFSMLDNFISERGFVTTEFPLQNSEKEFGVARDTDGRSNEYLLFDQEAVTQKEKQAIASFLDLVKEKGKEGLKGSKFEWYFQEESDEFVQALAKKIEERLASLEVGESTPSLASASLKGEDNLIAAAQSFREIAKRSQLKEALQKHFDTLPIKAFIGLKKDGKEEEIDPADIEYMFVENKNNDAQLIITCKNTEKYTQIVPAYYESEQEEVSDKKFRRIPGTGLKKTVSADKSSGRDLTHYEFTVDRGGAKVDPLFTTVKVLSAPVDLNKEIREYENTKAERKKKKAKPPSPTPTQTYAPSPPSYPSQPNYYQPTNYIAPSG